MPLNGFLEPRGVATLLAWLTSEDNAHLCGQIIYIDGGSDTVLGALAFGVVSIVASQPPG